MPIVAVISLGALGLIFGISLALVARKFGVQFDPREERIMSILPGANCGACGFPGCQAYCTALIAGQTFPASVSQCPVGGKEVSSKLARLLGVEHVEHLPKVAIVCCRGGMDKVGEKFVYQGVKDCLAACLLQDGAKNCRYGCLGLATCVRACPFDALRMGEDEIPIVNEEKCTGCGICVKACPRDIISLIPCDQKVYAACVSRDSGKRVREICAVGCFTCGLCVKVSSDSAITLENNLPKIHSQDMAKIGKAVEKCPAKVFVVREQVKVKSMTALAEKV